MSAHVPPARPTRPPLATFATARGLVPRGATCARAIIARRRNLTKIPEGD